MASICWKGWIIIVKLCFVLVLQSVFTILVIAGRSLNLCALGWWLGQYIEYNSLVYCTWYNLSCMNKSSSNPVDYNIIGFSFIIDDKRYFECVHGHTQNIYVGQGEKQYKCSFTKVSSLNLWYIMACDLYILRKEKILVHQTHISQPACAFSVCAK